MDIKVVLNALKSLGVGTGRDAFLYSLTRDLADGSSPFQKKPGNIHTPGEVVNQQFFNDGAVINFRNAKLSIKFFTDSLVRITWEPGKLPVPYTILAKDWQEIKINIEQNQDELTLSSKALTLSIDNDGSIQFLRMDRRVLRTDLPPVLSGEVWRSTTRFRDDEHIYGFGERAAALNLVGKSYRSWNTDPGGSYTTGDDPLYICTPVLMALGSTGSYLIYFENSFPATFDFHPLGFVQFSGGALQYYFSVGTPEELLVQYSELTGRPPLPPRWVFGYHQSRWGYRSDSEIRDLVAGFESHQIPIGAIHLDIDYMDGYRVFTTDKSRFPNLRQLSDDLKKKDINLVTIIDPGVKQDSSYPVYQAGIKENVFCLSKNNKVLHGVVWPGRAAYPDFTDPIVRQWWGENYRFHLDAGIAGFWHDMNEPVSFSAWGGNSLPRTTKHNLEGSFGNHLEAHNLYGFLMNKAAYESLRVINPDKRAWLISRSGWAGLQRYAWNWTGDVASTWQALKQTLVTLIGLSLSGHYFSGSDIGGFSGNPSAELYLRWLQLATFTPFFRTHSAIGTDRREPWSFGEPYTSIIRQYLLLRYQLIPYIYTLAWRATNEGIPVIRPLFWKHPDWRTSWDIDDQFYLGDDILVAPVLQPDSDSRIVILPPGNWYFYWDNSFFKGPTSITVCVSLEQIPIFIRAGSIIPLGNNEHLELHIYPTKQGSATGTLYSDCGDGFDASRVDEFECFLDGENLNIFHQHIGDFPPPLSDLSVLLHGHPAKHAQMNGIDIDLIIA